MVSTLLNPCRQWSILSPDSRHGTVTTQSRAAQKFVNVSEWKWQHWRPRTRHGTVNNTSIPTQPKKIFPVVVSRAYWEFQYLSIFCPNFGSCCSLLPVAFHAPHSTLIIIFNKFVTTIVRGFSSSFLGKILFIRSFSLASFAFSHMFTYLFVCARFWCILGTRICGSPASTMIRHTFRGQPCEAKNLCGKKVSPSIVNFRFTDLSVVFFWFHTILLLTFNTTFHKPNSYRYTGCFTTLGHNCRRWFPRSLW